MNVLAFLFALLVASPLSAQALAKQQERQPGEIQISREVAEKLLVHKVAPKEKCVGMPARVTGTVVIDLEIDIHGNAVHPVVISGPKMLQRAAIHAVRRYKYRPYLLKGQPVEVETTVLVPFTLAEACS